MSELKIGLEIHVQLNTGKLFCGCPSEISDSDLGKFTRTLYPTSGELGITDRAALFELSRGRVFEYTVSENSCLVEMDEEPPHPINPDAVRTALSLSYALGCLNFPRIFVMRKIVVDGSNTTGFQRTALVGVQGNIKVDGSKIGITTVCLEEDSARKTAQEGGKASYSLDRLGIPLVEISTDPDMKNADHAVEVAREIGYMVASTGMMKHGADAIRQDVNMSLGFGRVEIKGVSKLSLIRDVIENESRRQRGISEAISVLSERGGFDGTRIREKEVTDAFKNSGSRIIKGALQKGDKIYAFVLPGLSGLLKQGDYRLGRDIADALKPYGIKGLMHGDELPGYGLEEDLLNSVKNILNLEQNDSYAIIASPSGRIADLIRTVRERMEKLCSLDLSETRAANADGTTYFLRPLPGRERMYPETDIPVFEVTGSLTGEIMKLAPKSFEEQVSGMSEEYGLSPQDSSTIIRAGQREVLEELCHITDPKTAARIIIHTVPALEKEFDRRIENDVLVALASAIPDHSSIRLSMEPAMRLYLTEGGEISAIAEDRRVLPLGKDEISDLCSTLRKEEPEISEKTIISKLRKKSERPFDPVLALEVFRSSS